MKEEAKVIEIPTRDAMFNWGLIWVALNGLLFAFSLYTSKTNTSIFSEAFVISYLLTASYWFPVVFKAIFIRDSYETYYMYPALVLSLISCFLLNREMGLFSESVAWYSASLVLLSVAILTIPFYCIFSKWLQFVHSFISGVGILLLLYLSIYLMPGYPFGAMVFFIFGISLLIFTPLLMLIYIGKWIVKNWKEYGMLRFGIGSGSVFSLIVLFIYSMGWINSLSSIQMAEKQADNDLPDWIRVSQHLPANSFTEKVLMTDWIYQTSEVSLDGLMNGRFPEKQRHDPLITITSGLCGESSMGIHKKKKILNTLYDCRHESVDRLWSGDGLQTTALKTKIQIWPQYRMAYTEQTMHVCNTESWGQKEAIYTFHLPEGSVVTSLSLWVDGVERKSILTTVEKADSAYKQIVGIENRDPSLVHWQEGSTITLRVFPVLPKDERKFKIGVTTPLYVQENQLVYHPFYFEGTDFSLAKETMKIDFMEHPEEIKFPSFLKEIKEGNYESTSDYRRDWNIVMNKVPVSTGSFEFEGDYYFVKPLESLFVPVEIKDVYLDVNANWTKDEFNSVCNAGSGKNIWVYTSSGMQTVTDKNRKDLFDQLHQLRFSIFPLHLIREIESALVVSKSTIFSPGFQDLKDTDFMQQFKDKITPGQKINFFNLGIEDLTPYLKTLLEYRILQYQQGNMKDLSNVLRTNKIQQSGIESDQNIVINQAGISINKSKEGYSGNAPSHLMRLFAYNHILQQYAKTWNTDSIQSELVLEAQKAYVVSPVSSMIVLETDKDYERFGIEDIKVTLGNANDYESDGKSVPVGDLEWMGCLALLILAFLYVGKIRTQKSVS